MTFFPVHTIRQPIMKATLIVHNANAEDSNIKSQDRVDSDCVLYYTPQHWTDVM
jgi:hypothetical protein